MQEVLIMRVIAQELLNNIMFNNIIKVNAQEVLKKNELVIIAQEVQLNRLFKG